MASNKALTIGSKLYNVYFGPMTIIGFFVYDDNHDAVICCTPDDYDNLSDKYQKIYDLSPLINKDRPDINGSLMYVKWLSSGLGKYIFTTPEKAAAVHSDGINNYYPVPEQ